MQQAVVVTPLHGCGRLACPPNGNVGERAFCCAIRQRPPRSQVRCDEMDPSVLVGIAHRQDEVAPQLLQHLRLDPWSRGTRRLQQLQGDRDLLVLVQGLVDLAVAALSELLYEVVSVGYQRHRLSLTSPS